MNEYNSKRILSMYKIPVIEEEIVNNIEEAIKYANILKYPVVLKVCSDDILHKKKIGGVILNIFNDEELKNKYKFLKNKFNTDILLQKQIPIDKEFVIGYKVDEIFGSLIMFGMGGTNIEEEKNISFRCLPIKTHELIALISKYESNLNIVDKIVEIFKNIISMNIKELDINPLVLSGNDLIVIDALIL